LAQVLHEYYEAVVEMIFANGGSLVKFHDDWALALFGVIGGAGQDAAWAVDAALGLCSEFRALAAYWPRGGQMGLRCALDSGKVISGVVGSIDRLEYMAIGRPIVSANTIVRQAKGTTVLITAAIWSELPQGRYRVTPAKFDLGERKVFQLFDR
jgi:adenylate cyclase